MSLRIYVPATLETLAAFVAASEIPADADRIVADEADEEAEYAALMTAADASSTLLAGRGRRVVVVAEVADADAPVPFSRVVAVHADAEERPPGADPDEDLAWYATQEIEHLLSD